MPEQKSLDKSGLGKQKAKRLAIELRLSGSTLAQAAHLSNLSIPTVSSLVNAYQKFGWAAIENRKAGRPRGGSRIEAKQLENLKDKFLGLKQHDRLYGPTFTAKSLANWFTSHSNSKTDERAAIRRLSDWGLLPPDRANSAGTLFANSKYQVLWVRGPKGELLVMPTSLPVTDDAYCALFDALKIRFPKGLRVNLDFAGLHFTPRLNDWLLRHPNFQLISNFPIHPANNQPKVIKSPTSSTNNSNSTRPRKPITPTEIMLPATLTHLQRLEAESIAIMREVVAEAENPVMLYSIGKDSAVMLHLAVKAFYPAKIPFPLLHVDTTWKFQDMYRFRERMQKEHDFKLLIHTNEEGIKQGINPFTHGSQIHTDIMKTVALKQALDKHGFDVAFGGARRDEEKSRAKERVFSFRTKDHQWDPKNQRPELWSLYNTNKHKGESIRAFPISNWTELDIWQYIYLEDIPIVPLYFSAPRPVVNRDGTLIMVDDDRMPLAKGEVPMMKNVRFRTLGCYPLTGAVESKAATLEEVIQEMLLTKTSERQGRVIDHDAAASMEKKKREGYF
jgi:sulfate adenylyltransferase subunit 2